jgi:hypothetical protein
MSERGTPAPQPVKVQAPVRRDASAAVEVLERMLLSLHGLNGRFDRDAAAATLEAAVATLVRLASSDIDEANHLDLIDQAVAEVRRSQAGITLPQGRSETERAKKTLASIEQALVAARLRTIDAIVAQQDRMLRSPKAAVKAAFEPRPFRTSTMIPALHAVDLAKAPSWLRTAPDEDDDDPDEDPEQLIAAAESAPEEPALEEPAWMQDPDFDPGEAMAGELTDDVESLRALDALADDSPRKDPEDFLFQDVGLERIARDCMEEIGVLGMLRSARTTVASLSGLERFERRLLENLDALMSLALPHYCRGTGGKGWVETRFDVLAELHRYTGDASVPDPNRAFTRAFVLGCIEGELPVRAAMIAFRQAHPMTYEATAEALILAVNPGIGPALARLCTDAPPELLCRVLQVLRARREVPFARTAMLLRHPEAKVRKAAGSAMGVASERAAAVALFEEVLKLEDDAEVSAAIAESLAILGAPSGLAFARRKLGEELEHPGTLPAPVVRSLERLLGVGGQSWDAKLFARMLERGLECAPAVGWLGQVALVEPLLAALGKANAESRAASRAPTVLEVDAGRALYRITGAELQEREPEGEREADERKPVPDASRWEGWWKEHRPRFDPERKYRFGQAFSPLLTLEELSGDGASFAERTTGMLEISTLAGGSRLDTHDWVARQREEIAALRAAPTSTESHC